MERERETLCVVAAVDMQIHGQPVRAHVNLPNSLTFCSSCAPFELCAPFCAARPPEGLAVRADEKLRTPSGTLTSGGSVRKDAVVTLLRCDGVTSAEFVLELNSSPNHSNSPARECACAAKVGDIDHLSR